MPQAARIIVTSQGTVESTHTDEEAIAILKVIGTEPRATFARDLSSQFARTGKLSPRQWPWVHKLVVDHETRTTTPKVSVDIGSLEAIVKLFKKAQEHLKYPRITFEVSGNPVVASLAGPGAKMPGSINLSSSRKFREGVYYGRILPNGVFEPTSRSFPGLVGFLVEFAADPAAAASKYGRLVGSCIFCASPLDDPRSLSVGYGPVCADHWGLPWGAVEEEHDHRAPTPCDHAELVPF